MFDKPTAAPEPRSGNYAENPIGREIYYKSGKSQISAVKGKISPQDLSVKFTCREGAYEEGVKSAYIQLPAFTLYILGFYSRFAGQDYNEANPKDSDRFTSTLYRTPKDPIFFRIAGVKDVREGTKYFNYWTAGDYHQVRQSADMQDYRDKVGYKKIAICWCEELKDVIELQVNRKIEYGIAQSIAKATGTPRDPRRLNGINDLTTEFWAFRFTGDFVEVDDNKGKACEDYSGKKEWSFAPVFPDCGVIRSDGSNQELFALLAEKQALVDAYVDSQIEWAASIVGGGSTEEPTAAPQAQQENNFPTMEPIQMPQEIGALPTDNDLPF